jgi:hypothetical protein
MQIVVEEMNDLERVKLTSTHGSIHHVIQRSINISSPYCALSNLLGINFLLKRNHSKSEQPPLRCNLQQEDEINQS